MSALTKWLYDILDSELGDFTVFTGGSVVALYFLAAGINQLSLPGDLARIEALRAIVATAQPNEAEDVAGQVAAVNQDIASNKAYNATWYGALLIPNAWDTVTALTVPSVRPEVR